MSFPGVSCEIAFPTNPGVLRPMWYSANQWLLDYDVDSGGRGDEFSLMDAGTMRLALDNSDRRFEPGYAGSPYYPYVIPMRQVYLTETWPLNLIRPSDNTGFERGDFGTLRPFGREWVREQTGPAVWSVVTDTLHGSKAAKLAQPGGGAAGTGTIRSELVPCQGGAVFTYHALFRNPTAGGGGSGTLMGWRAYDAKRKLLTSGFLTALPSYVPGFANITFPTNGGNGFDVPKDATVRRYGGWFSVPATATYVEVYVTPYASTTLQRDLRLDAFSLRPGLDATLYEVPFVSDTFGGFAAPNSWPVTWNNRTSEIAVDCVDGNALLNRKKLFKYFASGLTDVQIGKMLDEAKWPTGTVWRALDAGRAVLQEQTVEGEPAGTHIQQCADSELGVAFMAGWQFRFMSRETRRLAARVAILSDKPGAGEFAYLRATPNTWPVYNDVQVLPVNGETPWTQTVADADVQQAKTLVPHTLERQPLVAYGTEAQAQANWLYNRYKRDNGPRIETVEIDPTRDDALWPLVLQLLKLGNRIQIKKTAIPGRKPADPPFLFDGYIERVVRNVSSRNRRTYKLTLTLSPAVTDIYGILDSATLGNLNSTMVLGF
jgi:hypothetical protein